MVLVAALVALMAWTAGVGASECRVPGTLGTSRVLRVDVAATPRVGLKQFAQSLPLRDHEVVLTFDDGPWPSTTPKVLAALALECVRLSMPGYPPSSLTESGRTRSHHTRQEFSDDDRSCKTS